jgi:hypothetical protein
MAKELDAVHAWHGQIGNDDIKGVFLEKVDAVFRRRRCEHFVTLLDFGSNGDVQIPDNGIIFDKEDAI